MTFRVAFMSTLVLSTALGCATTSLPQDRVTSLQASMRSAEEVGAKDVPQAALHLKLAEEELARAKQLAALGDPERAELFLRRAAVDAELALALTREDEAQKEVTQANAAVRRIQGESP
jgi:hypothetical protein